MICSLWFKLLLNLLLCLSLSPLALLGRFAFGLSLACGSLGALCRLSSGTLRCLSFDAPLSACSRRPCIGGEPGKDREGILGLDGDDCISQGMVSHERFVQLRGYPCNHSIHSGFAQPLLGVLSHPTCQSLYLLSCRAKDKFMNWALKLVLSGRARGVGHSILAPTETGKTEPSSAVVVSSKAGSADSAPPAVIPVSGKLLENLI